MTHRRVILAVFNDTHGGHSLGLLNPETTLYDEDKDGNLSPYHPTLTATQKLLWGYYLDDIREVYHLAGKDEIIPLHNGDECQGNKYPARIVSSRLADQISIAEDNLGMWLQVPNVKTMRLSIGTGAHDFLDGSSTILVTRHLQALYPQKSVEMGYHGLMDINGVTVDYAHHGPYPGSREWLKGNVARFYLRDLMLRDIEDGKRPPDLVMRAHYHSPVHETLEQGHHKSELYVVPSYCGLDDHSTQATQSIDRVTFGMLAIEIIDGKTIGEHRLYHTLDIRKREIL
jgi:hypothetical protein